MCEHSARVWLIILGFGLFLGGCAGKSASPLILTKSGEKDGPNRSLPEVSRTPNREPELISKAPDTSLASQKENQSKISLKLVEKLGPDSIDEILETPLAVSPQEKIRSYPSLGEYVAFSLRVAQNLIADVKNGEDYRPLYPQVYNLGGINTIHGLVYDRRNGDAILVGQHDPKRQPLTLDDLVVALKARFIHGTWPVVSLDPTKDTSNTGMQNVRFEGGIENTQFGADLLDADHRLKRIGMGFLPSGVPGLKGRWDINKEKLIENPNSYSKSNIRSRFWFYPVLPSVSVREEVVAMQGLQVGVFTEVLSAEINGKNVETLANYKDPASDRFAQEVTRHFKELSQVHLSFSRVQGLDELVALSKGIEQMEKQPEFNWWFEIYQVKKVETPGQVRMLKRKEDYRVSLSDGIIEGYRQASGGVQLMAIALRFESGDVTALKEAVLMTRPNSVALSWAFVVGEWIIPTSLDLVRRETVMPLFIQAEFFLDRNRYNEAITLYNKIIALNPDFAGAYINRGAAYAKTDRMKEAIADQTHALGLNPLDVDALTNRGAFYDQNGQFKEAMADFNRALTLNPNYAQAYNNRGSAFYDAGLLKEAIADFSRAIELKPLFAEAYANRGATYGDTGIFKKAIDDFLHAIEIKPQFAEAFYGLGNVYVASGNPNQAIAEFTRALEHNPGYVDALYNRGNTYAMIGHKELAIIDYSNALELNPRYVKAYQNRGILYREKEHFPEAISDFNRAIEIDPRNAKTYNSRGLAHMGAGHIRQGCLDFWQANELGLSNILEIMLDEGIC